MLAQGHSFFWSGAGQSPPPPADTRPNFAQWMMPIIQSVLTLLFVLIGV